ncbi:MAG: hypothetical protein M1827_007752 [Pycnora praestabilis]|nr:MAG: hypothetical protein M1827_007752 [Pycnora praestabilis]
MARWKTLTLEPDVKMRFDWKGFHVYSETTPFYVASLPETLNVILVHTLAWMGILHYVEAIVRAVNFVILIPKKVVNWILRNPGCAVSILIVLLYFSERIVSTTNHCSGFMIGLTSEELSQTCIIATRTVDWERLSLRRQCIGAKAGIDWKKEMTDSFVWTGLASQGGLSEPHTRDHLLHLAAVLLLLLVLYLWHTKTSKPTISIMTQTSVETEGSNGSHTGAAGQETPDRTAAAEVDEGPYEVSSETAVKTSDSDEMLSPTQEVTFPQSELDSAFARGSIAKEQEHKAALTKATQEIENKWKRRSLRAKKERRECSCKVKHNAQDGNVENSNPLRKSPRDRLIVEPSTTQGDAERQTSDASVGSTEFEEFAANFAARQRWELRRDNRKLKKLLKKRPNLTAKAALLPADKVQAYDVDDINVMSKKFLDTSRKACESEEKAIKYKQDLAEKENALMAKKKECLSLAKRAADLDYERDRTKSSAEEIKTLDSQMKALKNGLAERDKESQNIKKEASAKYKRLQESYEALLKEHSQVQPAGDQVTEAPRVHIEGLEDRIRKKDRELQEMKEDETKKYEKLQAKFETLRQNFESAKQPELEQDLLSGLEKMDTVCDSALFVPNTDRSNTQPFVSTFIGVQPHGQYPQVLSHLEPVYNEHHYTIEAWRKIYDDRALNWKKEQKGNLQLEYNKKEEELKSLYRAELNAEIQQRCNKKFLDLEEQFEATVEKRVHHQIEGHLKEGLERTTMLYNDLQIREAAVRARENHEQIEQQQRLDGEQTQTFTNVGEPSACNINRSRAQIEKYKANIQEYRVEIGKIDLKLQLEIHKSQELRRESNSKNRQIKKLEDDAGTKNQKIDELKMLVSNIKQSQPRHGQPSQQMDGAQESSTVSELKKKIKGLQDRIRVFEELDHTITGYLSNENDALKVSKNAIAAEHRKVVDEKEHLDGKLNDEGRYSDGILGDLRSTIKTYKDFIEEYKEEVAILKTEKASLQRKFDGEPKPLDVEDGVTKRKAESSSGGNNASEEDDTTGNTGMPEPSQKIAKIDGPISQKPSILPQNLAPGEPAGKLVRPRTNGRVGAKWSSPKEISPAAPLGAFSAMMAVIAGKTK